MEYLPLLMMGVLLTTVGIPNLMGSPASIHRYNRRRVREEDLPAYGRAMGLGSTVMGASVVVSAVLLMIFHLDAFYWLIAAGCAAGLAVILYAQFRYNGGLF